jgi:hypothetical protein
MKKKRLVIGILLGVLLIVVLLSALLLYDYYRGRSSSPGRIEGTGLVDYCKVNGEFYKVDFVQYKKDHPNEAVILLDSTIQNLKYLAFYKRYGVPCINYYNSGDTSYSRDVAQMYKEVDTVMLKNRTFINAKIRNAPKSFEIFDLDINKLYPFDWIKLIKLDKNREVFKNIYEVSNDEYFIINTRILIYITKRKITYYVSF